MKLTIIDGIFLFYMFVGLYMLSLFIFIYIKNKKQMFSYPKPSKLEPISIIIPCFNEEKTIGKTIESLLNLDYPKDKIEIIVVDDKSTDNSAKIVEKYIKKYSNVKLIVNKKNSGGAAQPTNIGIRAAKHNFVAVTDADSTPLPDSLKKMIGFLQTDDSVAAVTCSVLAKEPKTFIQKLQAIEYAVIAFGRKLLDFVDSVYVTPGPLALYRKKALLKVGLFDEKNMTQDIEIVWRLIANGYKARMSLSARVYSETPDTFKKWFKQRIRWNIGGTQCLIKYKNKITKAGMLGTFIFPFFSFSLFLGLFGIGLFVYLLTRNIIYHYLSTSYSVQAQATIFRLSELTFVPSVLNFLGASMFILGSVYTILIIHQMNDPYVKNKNVFNTLFYMIVYLTLYPLIMLVSLYKLVTKKYSW